MESKARNLKKKYLKIKIYNVILIICVAGRHVLEIEQWVSTGGGFMPQGHFRLSHWWSAPGM